MKNQEPTKLTGNLEELFRHHLADAAVPPAPRMWEQVDNALLLAENQTYRRRLRTTRWLAAASLLLATLAGAGWWEDRELHPTEVATTTTSTTPYPTDRVGARQGLGAPGGVGNLPANQPGSSRAAAQALSSNPGPAANSASPTGSLAPSLPEGLARRTRQQGPAAGQLAHRPELELAFNKAGNKARASWEQTTIPAPTKRRAAGHGQQVAAGTADSRGVLAAAALAKPNKTGPPTGVLGPVGSAGSSYAVTPATTRSVGFPSGTSAALPDATAANPAALSPLAGGLVSLAQLPVPPLPAPLPPLPTPTPDDPATVARRWQLGVGYAAGLFQANVDFSRGGTADARPSYNPALGDNSPALSEAAAAEYRTQQRPGLSQRLRLQASRRLRGHWSLETGLEVAQQESRSATSYIFTGEQVPDLSQPLGGGPRQATSARYRTAGLPLELRYANSAKTGFSLYGRLGAVVSALLTSRTEVEGNPEATRTYSLLSASTPYRRVLGTARGAAGVQFQPLSHDYTLSLGPVAEGGLWSLNAHPNASFLGQSRPYSLGLEATVEFGRSAKASKPE